MTISAPYHNTRTLLIPPTNPELLLVQRGSVLNIDNGTTDPAEGRAMVKIFNRVELDKMAPINYTSAGIVFGMGLRNSVGWGQDPTTGYIVSTSASAIYLLQHLEAPLLTTSLYCSGPLRTAWMT